MLYSYNAFLNESKKSEKKINKQKQKIKKFLWFEPIMDFVFEKAINVVENDDGSTTVRGLKYTTWFCDRIMKGFSEKLASTYNDWNISESSKEKIKNLGNIAQFFLDYLKSGEFNTEFEDDVKKKVYNSWTWHEPQIGVIVDWLNSPIREEEIVSLDEFKTLEEAEDRAKKWHDSIKATGIVLNEKGTVIMTFDDGYYWIDLETTYSEDEAKAMGHCGTTTYGSTLLSLRRKQKPYVTIAYGLNDNNDGVIFQAKGRENKKPIEKYHPYIFELLSYPNISDHVTPNMEYLNSIDNEIFESDDALVVAFDTEEYMPSEDFHVSDLSSDLIKKLWSRNKGLIDNCGVGVKYKLAKEGIMTKEEFVELYDDLAIVNGEIHLLLSDWSQFEEDIWADDNKKLCHALMNGEAYQYFEIYDTLEFDYNYHWSKLNEDVIKQLYEICVKAEPEICYDSGEAEDCFVMSEKNTDLNSKKDDVIIKTPIGGVLNLSRLLEYGYQEIDTEEGNVEFRCDAQLDFIKEEINIGYTMAQESADESEAWEAATDAILDYLGKIVKDPSPDKDWWDDGKIHIKPNFEKIGEVDEYTDGVYKSIIDLFNAKVSRGDTYEKSGVDLKKGHRGWHGTIDDYSLNDSISNKLYDL